MAKNKIYRFRLVLLACIYRNRNVAESIATSRICGSCIGRAIGNSDSDTPTGRKTRTTKINTACDRAIDGCSRVSTTTTASTASRIGTGKINIWRYHISTDRDIGQRTAWVTIEFDCDVFSISRTQTDACRIATIGRIDRCCRLSRIAILVIGHDIIWRHWNRTVDLSDSASNRAGLRAAANTATIRHLKILIVSDCRASGEVFSHIGSPTLARTRKIIDAKGKWK